MAANQMLKKQPRDLSDSCLEALVLQQERQGFRIDSEPLAPPGNEWSSTVRGAGMRNGAERALGDCWQTGATGVHKTDEFD